MAEGFVGLAHIGLYTRNIEESKRFYTENLGFQLDYEVTMDQPEGAWLKIAFINLNGMIIELLESSNKESNKVGNAGCVDHLAIEVKDLPLLVEKLKAKGITFETEEPIVLEKLFKGVRIIFFRGPSEERLELFEFIG